MGLTAIHLSSLKSWWHHHIIRGPAGQEIFQVVRAHQMGVLWAENQPGIPPQNLINLTYSAVSHIFNSS